MNKEEEKKCYHLLQCMRVKWCQKALKQTILHPQKHISSIKQEKPSKVINNQHNLQTQSSKTIKNSIKNNQNSIKNNHKKQSFNSNQAKTSTITHQSKTQSKAINKT